MQELTVKGGITIIVSHSMPAICEMCDRCIWFEQGKIMMDGTSKEVTEAYLKWVRARQDDGMFRNIRRLASRLKRSDIKIEELEIVDKKGEHKNMVMVGDETTIRFAVHVEDRPIEFADLRLCIHRSDGFLVSENTARADGFEIGRLEGAIRFEIPYGPMDLGLGLYEVTIEVLDLGGEEGKEEEVVAIANAIFKIENPTPEYGNPLIYPVIDCSIDHQVCNRSEGKK
jgi:lipopolysaccharide transport system ATP-binding protein